MPITIITRSPIALDQEHLEILNKLQAKFQHEEEKQNISRSEVMRRALKELAKANNI